jgi:hypothetical protein
MVNQLFQTSIYPELPWNPNFPFSVRTSKLCNPAKCQIEAGNRFGTNSRPRRGEVIHT